MTQRFAYLDEGDIADVRRDSWTIYDARGERAARPVVTIEASGAAVELGPYRHFMQKEIFEQPRAVADTLEGRHRHRCDALRRQRGARTLPTVDSVLILACGTSYYSALVAKQWIESIARIPCTAEIASEYRYRDSVPNPAALVVVVSQSGETADTLGGAEARASARASRTRSRSATSRRARWCGRRRSPISPAPAPRSASRRPRRSRHSWSRSSCWRWSLAKLRDRLTAEEEAHWLRGLRHLPAALQAALALEPQVIAWAQRFAAKEHALFLGRGLHYPIALEGALKLKEISYIHAEAYPAGELKHGPLALVDASMPVVVIAPNDALLEKLKSNLQEVRARGGELYVVADLDSRIASGEGVHVIRLPEHAGHLSPIVHTIPLQLLAYHAAAIRGTDVDKPRNLAKSVTVE